MGPELGDTDETDGVAASTVKDVLAETLPEVAATFAVPVATELANPGVLPLIEAIVLLEELQVTEFVRLLVLPSE
jgi:hypothetical protein